MKQFDLLGLSNADSNSEIIEKLEKIVKNMNEIEEIINELVEKVKILEENLLRKEDTTDEHLEEDIEMNTTFFNPSVGISCENCDFIAKNKSGLQVHMKAKHRENREMLKQAIVSCESIT